MHGQTGWDGQMDGMGWMDEWMGGIDGQTGWDGWMDGQDGMDEWTDTQIGVHSLSLSGIPNEKLNTITTALYNYYQSFSVHHSENGIIYQ